MDALLVLELRRREVFGSMVSLDPNGFWNGWQRHAFTSHLCVYSACPPPATRHAFSRQKRCGTDVLLAQFAAHPWQIPPHVVLDAMKSYAVSPSFDELCQLADGETRKESGLVPFSSRS